MASALDLPRRICVCSSWAPCAMPCAARMHPCPHLILRDLIRSTKRLANEPRPLQLSIPLIRVPTLSCRSLGLVTCTQWPAPSIVFSLGRVGLGWEWVGFGLGMAWLGSGMSLVCFGSVGPSLTCNSERETPLRASGAGSCTYSPRPLRRGWGRCRARTTCPPRPPQRSLAAATQGYRAQFWWSARISLKH